MIDLGTTAILRGGMLRSLLRFATVGIANTALDFAVFTLLERYAGVAPGLANIVSYSCGVLFSFITNRRWTFADISGHNGALRQFALFVGVNAAGLSISTIIVVLGSNLLTPIGAKLLALPVTLAWNFTLSRLVVFAARSKVTSA